MTIDEFWVGVERYKSLHTNQRIGQSVFNYLYLVKPDLADKVRGSHIDPFHVMDDDLHQSLKYHSFQLWLENNWNEKVE